MNVKCPHCGGAIGVTVLGGGGDGGDGGNPNFVTGGDGGCGDGPVSYGPGGETGGGYKVPEGGFIKPRVKKFAWLPTRVHSSLYYREGFRWFSYVYWEGDKAFTHK